MTKRKIFSQAICEKIGYYVYLLKDPRTSTTFYVGKGNENRVFEHVSGALNSPAISDKLELIREIYNSGLEVEHYVLRHGLSQEQAFEIESACIDLLGLDNLTNSVKGHDSWERGLKTVDEIIQHYDAKIITITEPAIIIKINKQYKRFMTRQELYQTTRSAWNIGQRGRDIARYAIASYLGLVREVYEIDSWSCVGKRRWEFIGKVADNSVRDKYINQSLDNYRAKKGDRHPIKYTF